MTEPPMEPPAEPEQDGRPENTIQEPDELLRLASVIAHQLKSPLSSVETVLSTVLGGFAGPLESRQRWLLEKARQRCTRGTVLVRDLLRLRTVERLNEESLGPVNVAAVFSAAITEATEEAAEKRQILQHSIELDEVNTAWTHGDTALIREIVGVLLNNALKYSPEKGKIECRLVTVERDEDTMLQVEVMDSGIGIPPEGYSQLFREFYRAPNAKQLATEGTGLGLAFAWRAARRLGGEVALEPAPTGGVLAMARFPLKKEYTTGPDEHEQISGSAEGERVISQRVVIVGGVTAGSKAAARIMRLDPDADVTIVERGQFLAYSGCGLPYYISGTVSDQQSLLETSLGVVRDSAFFHRLKNVRALELTEAMAIDRERHRVVVENVLDRQRRELPYDRLILCTGARPVKPELPGNDLPGIHTLHGVEDAEAIRSGLAKSRVQDVVIVGGGLLGCQITEAISQRGARITLIEKESAILRFLDVELAMLVRTHLRSHGVRILCSTQVTGFEGDDRVSRVVLSDGSHLPADLVLVALGRRPRTRLAEESGLEIGPTGAIKVDQHLRTNDPAISAAGDCIEQVHTVTGQPSWIPGAVPAILQGRVAADNACGRSQPAPKVTGTFIVKLFEWAVGCTGLTEQAAIDAGLDVVTAVIPGPDRAHYLPTARNLVFKLVVDKETGRVLGAQAIGPGAAAKRIDVISTALSAGLDVEALLLLTPAYAPPFSMAMSTVTTAANVVRNKLDGIFRGIAAPQLWQQLVAPEPPFVIDVRQPAEYETVRLRGSRHIPVGSLRSRIHEVPRDRPIVVLCSFGLRSYEASLILKAHGFDRVQVLDGGLEAWPYHLERLT